MGTSSIGSRPRALINPLFDHESCGVGFVASLDASAQHDILRLALTALARLAHRGAVAADRKSSDGVGVLTAIPRDFLLKEAGVKLPPERAFAAGMLFLPQDETCVTRARVCLQECMVSERLQWLAWRAVPTRPEVLGEIAAASMPVICQALIAGPAEGSCSEAEIEHRLYLARKTFERQVTDSYVCSLSTRTIVYKALCAGRLLHEFYPDLDADEFVTPFAIFHQRYATNVLPSWHRAQPLRMLAHNGEINTIWGNRAHIEARRATLPPECEPILSANASDSMSLDEIAELLAKNGRNVAEAIRMLLPPAPSGRETDFHRYHADCMEPWDGPSALVFSDGRLLGAALDRNGLRPLRYLVTDTGLLIAGSEVGLAEVSPDSIVRSGRLGPGQLILLDLEKRHLLEGETLDRYFEELMTYAPLIDDIPLEGLPEEVTVLPEDELTRLQRGFGYTREDLKMFVAPMALEGKEATWSMGDDTPIAPLARTPRPLYGFFRQRFAQVTNPPIDSLRESCVVSLRTRLGPWAHLLDKHAPLPGLVLPSPFLSLGQMAALHHRAYPMQEELPLAHLDCVFAEDDALSNAIDILRKQATELVRHGARILLLTDRFASPQSLPMPMALATGAVHHALVKAGLRTNVGLAVEAGDCRDVHHAAVLIGYGAGAVCPWLALQTARNLAGAAGEAALLKAMQAGMAKVMSKMGISVLDSYRAAQLFDILGLDAEVVERCFPGSPSPLEGWGFAEIESAARASWAAEHRTTELPDYGWVRFRRDDGAEPHLWEPQRTRQLQLAVGSAKGSAQTAVLDPDVQAQAWAAFRGYTKEREPQLLRDLLEFVPAASPIPVDQVEARSTLARRFVSSAMSLGSLSPEAHETITVAMNQLGGRSNTGEGGEDPAAYHPLPGAAADFLPRNNKIKQVASGRFGVTAEYLAHAEELEIKIAQGSKPGEGGQLPGHKVTELIARLRHAQPGISLISPPPHHDIYSIEDLAQLIYDLKRINPRAAVGVKLVAQLGVGTVAAGVAKAYADYIHISGHSGGTGASPLSSIKYAGNPWELGLAEAQQVLRHNGLRGRVRLRVDGGFSTARDVLIAAILGADEFSFGTAVLVSLGCDMARQCHLNTCPTGIATQRPDLRAKFRGKPENAVRFFHNIAGDLQQLLAELGLPTLESAIGRTDLLRQVRGAGNLNLESLLAEPSDGARHWEGHRNLRPEEHAPIDDAWVEPALLATRAGNRFECDVEVRNEDRTLGARLAGELALLRCHEAVGKPDIRIRMRGTAGQSFGAFCCEGMSLMLEGQANDYVGKGLSGGELILRPTGKLANTDGERVILGNVALYGATAGFLFAAGGAGERFAIRNSGATAVVEGVGEHGCEYMTGGVVVVLGRTGRNFGAGMTGGVAYVWDQDKSFVDEQKFHPEFVETKALADCVSSEREAVRELIQQHVDKTGSRSGQQLANRWQEVLAQMVCVAPKTAAAS